jgi:hypothetical protein
MNVVNVGIWTEAAQFLFWEYINGVFVAVYSNIVEFLQDLWVKRPV